MTSEYQKIYQNVFREMMKYWAFCLLISRCLLVKTHHRSSFLLSAPGNHKSCGHAWFSSDYYPYALDAVESMVEGKEARAYNAEIGWSSHIRLLLQPTSAREDCTPRCPISRCIIICEKRSGQANSYQGGEIVRVLKYRLRCQILTPRLFRRGFTS